MGGIDIGAALLISGIAGAATRLPAFPTTQRVVTASL